MIRRLLMGGAAGGGHRKEKLAWVPICKAFGPLVFTACGRMLWSLVVVCFQQCLGPSKDVPKNILLTACTPRV